MKKILAATLALAMMTAPLLSVPAAADEALEPITLTVFRGDPGDQPADDNKIYQKIADETGASSATISRVKRSLSYGAEGYDRVLDRITEEDK